jgi:S1-C subfamily serine protease|tara:strand:+ start:953 stop:1345 length:393 start_codon:yes stop_codon:yes gene_type:complete
VRKLALLLLLVTSLAGCAELLYQPERVRQWPDLGLRIAVLVVPAADDAAVVQRRFVVRNVRPNTPAQNAGVLVGDLLLALDDRVISSVSEVLDVMRSKTKRDQVVLTVRRADKILEFAVDLAHATLHSSI